MADEAITAQRLPPGFALRTPEGAEVRATVPDPPRESQRANGLAEIIRHLTEFGSAHRHLKLGNVASRPAARKEPEWLGTWVEPTLLDVIAAAGRIRPYLAPTALRHSVALSEMIGAETYLKHEHHLPTGAFKVRGGVNLVSQLSESERRAGVIAASTGNHGQSVAYAARLFGVQAIICAPQKANAAKVEAMKELGATVKLVGADFDDARVACEELAAAMGYRYIHSGNEPMLIAGVGTHTLEILAEQPQIDVIVVPVGGGSGAAGACITAKALNPNITVIAVQAEKAPSAYLSWKAGKPVDATTSTWAEGLATRTPFELPQQILRRLLDDFVLVSEGSISDGVRTLLDRNRLLVEGAAAASLAAALQLKERLAGHKVALILTGGNISSAQLKAVLEGA
jgi:threonine dehydratase